MSGSNNLINPSSQKKTLVSNIVRVKLIPVSESGSIFNYKDPFDSFSNSVPDADDENCISANVDKIIYTSDASPSSCQLSFVDKGSSVYNFKNLLNFFNRSTIHKMPKIGDGIAIFMYNDRSRYNSGDVTLDNINSSSGWVVVFKGYVTSISRSITSSGSRYSINCDDLKIRLTDNCIKKTYNNSYKIASIPNLIENNGSQDVLENPYTTERLTVEEIVNDIFDYAGRTSMDTSGYISQSGNNKIVFFNASNIDWNGNNDLKDFIPQTLTFENITILEAIYRTINSYGNYRIVLDYSDNKLYIVKLSYGAKHCGDEIKLSYGNSDGNNYWHDIKNSKEWYDVNVVSDNTSRRLKETCNILRCYSAPIEWYSGHYYIRDNYYYTTDNNSGNFVLYGSEDAWDKNGWYSTDKRFYLTNKNFDGYDYVFSSASVLGMDDDFKEAFYIVGAPLYPSWNVYKGYNARTVVYDGYIKYKYDNLSDSKDPIKKPQQEVVRGEIKEKLGCTENDAFGFVDPDFQSVMSVTSAELAKGYTYEAWFPYGVCWHCGGCGAVDYDASSYSDIFGKTRMMSGALASNLVVSGNHAFNYEFISETNPINGKTVRIPTKHPLPWKNTCPVCKGTGMEPWFRMVNVLNTLVDVTPDLTKIGEKESNTTIETFGQSRDKTFSEIAQQRGLRKNAIVYIEDEGGGLIYDRTKLRTGDTTIEHTMANETTLFGAHDKIFSDREKYINGLFPTLITEAKGFSIDSSRGLIIFKEKKNIACYRQQYGISPSFVNGDYMHKYIPVIWDNSTGIGHVKYAGKGTMGGTHQRAKSYWRPSRAWLSCYFTRDMFRASLGSEFSGTSNFKSYFSGNSEETVTRKIRNATSGDPEDNKQYTISAGVEDNRYYIEIRGARSYGTDYNVRPAIKGVTMDSFRWQVCPFDFGRWNVAAFTQAETQGGSPTLNKITIPNSYENLWNGVYKITNTSKSYMFSSGSVLSSEEMNDEELKSLGYTTAQIQGLQRTDIFNKVLRWVHRDDRVKLIERGLAELERRNDVQITGTISIRGGAPKFAHGFGFIEFDKKTVNDVITNGTGVKACIVKMELDFTNGCVLNLEVSTEEMRIGQKKEEDLDYQRKLESIISNLNFSSAYSLNSVPSGYYFSFGGRNRNSCALNDSD